MRLPLKRPGDSWALSLRLMVAAVAFIALLVAIGAGISPVSVVAHPCPEGTMADHQDYHLDFNDNLCTEATHDKPHENVIEVDGGRDRELVLKVYPPSVGYLDANDNISITLPEFDLSGLDLGANFARIKLNDSGNGTEISPEGVATEGQTLTLTLPASPDLANDAGEYLVVTIEKGSGILTPETPRGFDDPSVGYPVAISFDGTDATDKNFVVVKNPVSSTVPNARVRVELATHAEALISGSEEIMVDFSGPSADSEFSLPSTITTTRITIRPVGEASFSPSDVLVQGGRVNLTIPEEKEVQAGDYTISFSQLANIRNPFAAGNRTITVSSFVPGDLTDEITAVIKRTTTISPLEGPRGGDFTVQGRGYAAGTVTVFDGDDGTIDPGETLASVKTSRGSFTSRLKARGEPGEPTYRVWTRDSNGVNDSVVFNITSATAFEPSTVSIGGRLKITISDWEDEHQEVAAVRIGGVDAYTTKPVEYDNCFDYPNAYFADESGEVSFDVIVPLGVPPGEQTVAIFGHDELSHFDINGEPIPDLKACADLNAGTSRGLATGRSVTARVKIDPIALIEKTVEIGTQAVTVSPSTAVRGQRVTISGSGFTQSASNDINAISIDGLQVVEDTGQFEVSHNGAFVATVTVPMGVRAGDSEVRVVGNESKVGTGSITVPDPTIELVPPESQRGEQVAVRGSGFPANWIVLLSYGGKAVGVGQSDGRGNFEESFTVPLDAEIGRTHRVVAEVNVDIEDSGDSIKFEAGADHATSAATVTTSPDPAYVGRDLTIQGENFPPFALVREVRFGNRDFTPLPIISTDQNGRFEMEIYVQGVEPGDQSLHVEASGVMVTHVLEVAEPMPGGPPDQVFRNLIQSGVLLRVWYLERSTQEWFFFDPAPEFAGFSNLVRVVPDEVVVIHLSSPHEFQGESLVAGWNPIAIR